MSKKTISIQDILDAIELDNVPLNRGGWFKGTSDTKIGAACILGQAAVNLGVTSGSIDAALNMAVAGSASKIISMNDTYRTPYDTMVLEAKKMLKGKEHITYEAETMFFYSQLKDKAI